MRRLEFRQIILALTMLCMFDSVYAVCTASYTTRNEWATGYVIDVTIKNSGMTPFSDWKVSWDTNSLLTPVGDAWRAHFMFGDHSVVAVDNGDNPVIGAGQAVTFGIPVTFSGSRPVFTGMQLSAAGCGKLFVNPRSNAAKWVAANPADSHAIEIRQYIAETPTAYWVTGGEDVTKAVATYMDAADKVNQIAILVAYNIPVRDCGGASAGGAKSSEAYKKWIADFAAAIGSRAAIVVLEPDAIPHMTAAANCFVHHPEQTRASRTALIKYAVDKFNELAPYTYVYLDAGNSSWVGAEEMSTLLIASGIEKAHGFSLNVSNFKSDDATISYGKKINVLLQKKISLIKPFLIDSSRNGNGPPVLTTGTSVWCDPHGRRIGVRTGGSSDGQPELRVWIKLPGNLDGCDGPAGSFSPEMATSLINGY